VSEADQATSAVRDEVRTFVRDIAVYLPPGRELADDDDLVALGAIDSLGFVELVEEVQARYGVEVADDEITEENFGSVTSIARYVGRRR
jgi:acyl carrier protein